MEENLRRSWFLLNLFIKICINVRLSNRTSPQSEVLLNSYRQKNSRIYGIYVLLFIEPFAFFKMKPDTCCSVRWQYKLGDTKQNLVNTVGQYKVDVYICVNKLLMVLNILKYNICTSNKSNINVCINMNLYFLPYVTYLVTQYFNTKQSEACILHCL